MKFANLLRSPKDSDYDFPWLLRHGRAYYAAFWIVTGVSMILLGLGLMASSTIFAAFPFTTPFAVAFIANGLLMFFLAFTVGKDMDPKSWRSRLKKLVLIGTAALILTRGIIGATLTVYAFWFALIAPVWTAFVILWVAPIIWYLPTNIDEFLSLRGRLDSAESKTDGLEKELKRMKVDRLRKELEQVKKDRESI